MTDIHAVIAELKALEAKEDHTLADQLDICNALPQLLAYIEKVERSERDCDSACNTIVSAVCAERDMLEEKAKAQVAYIEKLESVVSAAIGVCDSIECYDAASGNVADDEYSMMMNAKWSTLLEALDATNCDLKNGGAE